MSFEELSNKILKELNEVLLRVEQHSVRSFMDSVKKANRIFCVGVGREGLATRAFAMRLMHMGKEVHWIWDDTTPNLQKGDLLILTSGSGEIGHLHYVAEMAKSAKVTIAVVTGTPDRKTPKLADVVLWIPACVYKGKDNVVPSIQPMGNLFEQSLLILFDMIIILLTDELNISYLQMSEHHRNVE
ncbi:6-phospho-3-hexuloisomerase [Neobacillus sp. PS3-12]|uniref:6-phospho-3-hexuloisomerase n=1 Tax=Neobacillus sp. PS3-12 TaxID=3070677 RepID=UPI0027E00338|nr:6-phospho-3-hexuloisomerase [Neobacillus sp. PS3-12]WML54809.1 6-phospho-3-hexuloisomerase [Neobacillus sp. PS3-12]